MRILWKSEEFVYQRRNHCQRCGGSKKEPSFGVIDEGRLWEKVNWNARQPWLVIYAYSGRTLEQPKHRSCHNRCTALRGRQNINLKEPGGKKKFSFFKAGIIITAFLPAVLLESSIHSHGLRWLTCDTSHAIHTRDTQCNGGLTHTGRTCSATLQISEPVWVDAWLLNCLESKFQSIFFFLFFFFIVYSIVK